LYHQPNHDEGEEELDATIDINMNEESVGIIPELRSEKFNPLQSQVFSLGNITTAPEDMIQLES
jgi:hypothetical protein